MIASDPRYSVIFSEHVADLDQVEPYQPGSFYRRELPDLRQVLSGVERLDLLTGALTWRVTSDCPMHSDWRTPSAAPVQQKLTGHQPVRDGGRPPRRRWSPGGDRHLPMNLCPVEDLDIADLVTDDTDVDHLSFGQKAHGRWPGPYGPSDGG